MGVKEIKNNFKEWFFKEEYTFNQKMMHISLIAGVVGGLLEILAALLFQYNQYVNLFILGIVISAAISLFISVFGKKSKLAAYFFIFTANLILLPCIYFFNGGLDCGCVFWMLLGITLCGFFFTGKHKFIAGIISVIGIISALVLSAIRPELVHVRPKMSLLMVEYIFSMIVVSCIYAVLFKYQAVLSERQKRELETAMEKAKKASEAKTFFLSNVTHDIRTPLNSIIGSTELARLNNDNRSFLYDCLENISVSGEHLLGLVNQVLDISQIESGIINLELDTASIGSVVNKVSKIMEPELQTKNLSLNVDLSAVRDDTVICDSLHLNQVFINIITNAIKYSHPEGKIDFIVEQKTNLKDGKVNMDFKIKDYGIGMSQNFCEHIFEPFQRDENSKIKENQGTGLGLHIAKNFIDMMKGTIQVNSVLGKGTEFIINLDFDVPTLSEIPDEDSVKNNQFEGKRILLVDDNEANREITLALLRDNGFIADEAETGNIAIDKVSSCENEFYDIILMDIHMPGKDGYETTQIIRSLDKPYVKELPIIALSAYVYEDDRRRALECGMNGYITKPFSIKELFKILDFILIDDKKKHIFKKF